MGHAIVSATSDSSVTPWIWQHQAKENYYAFAPFNNVVDTKTSKPVRFGLGIETRF